MTRPFWILLPLLALAACGDLPQPFLGNPGAAARVLAVPPTPRLAVPVPTEALLPDEASKAFAVALADGMQAQEVPSVAERVTPYDWRLTVKADQKGETVVPHYTVRNQKDEAKGSLDGPPVPTRAWAEAAPATLQKAAADAAPNLATLLTALQHADPNSVYNRGAKVQFVPVTGAPGDGNTSLSREMRAHLKSLGVMLQDGPEGADFILRGTVKATPLGGGQQRIAIDWTVLRPDGDLRGKISQGNDVPTGSLDHYWGDVAVVVASQGAPGIKDVILRQSGHDPNEEQSAQPAQPARGQAPGPLLEGQGTGQQRKTQ